MLKSPILVKFTLLAFFFFVGNMVFSQSYTAFDGTIFNVGDTIIIGYRSKAIGFTSTNKSYNYIMKYYRYSNNIDGYKNIEKDLSMKRFIITKIFKDNNDFYGVTTFEVIPYNNSKNNYYISIDSAIRNGEVCLNLNPVPSKRNIYLSDIIAFINYIRLSKKNSDQAKEEFLYRFLYKNYIETYQDEFEYHSSLDSAKINYEKQDTLPISTTYSLNVILSINKYDFTKKGFPIKEKVAQCNLLNSKNKLPMYSVDASPKNNYSSISINFINFKKNGFFLIKPENAKKFIAHRKNPHSGIVDRKVYAKFIFNIIGTSLNDKNERILNAKIKSIEFYEFDNMIYNYLGTERYLNK